MESKIARDKSEDMRDISIRLRNALTGITMHPLEDIPDDCVLVTLRLLPSDTVFLADRHDSAVLLEYGSTGSHAALFTREMGLPCISGIPKILSTFPNRLWTLVDASAGTVTICPQEKQKTNFRKKISDAAHAGAGQRASGLCATVGHWF